MRKTAASVLLLSALVAALAACTNKAPKLADTNAFPARYKEEIIDALRTIFDKNDTQSVSNAMIADPVIGSVDNEQHYTACVRYTAHGTIYNLTANAERIAYFYGGHLNQLVEATKEQCGNAAYKPFPELDQVCVGKGCK
jgi:hypothetical protein